MVARRSADSRYQESALARLAAEGLERGPARVDALLLVFVRLEVEILAADRTEAGAVGPAEDLVGHRERHLVSRDLAPSGDRIVEVVTISDDVDAVIAQSPPTESGTSARGWFRPN